MRVISGTARGRKLAEPVGSKIRPTSGKVKESIFNIVQFDVEGRRVLDLFAGTGQLGIEALSRGARNAVFVDSASDSTKLIRENVNKCGLSANSVILTCDALKALETKEKFDLIFVDPPYDTQLAGKALLKVAQFDKLDINGILICELRTDSQLPVLPVPYLLQKEYKYGGVKIVKYTREPQ